MELRLDMVTLCRTCLQDGEAHMVSIYDADDKLLSGISLCEKIESLSGIQIKPTEDLPTRICSRCKAFLTLAHKFRQICQRSNEFLKKYVVKDGPHQVEKDVVEQVDPISKLTPPPTVETEQYEQLEVEVLEEGAWATEDLVEETPPPAAEMEKPMVLDVQTVPVPDSAPSPAPDPTPAPAVIGKLYVCDICGNGYPRKSTLDTHMRRHNNEKPYE
ncbi:transcription factor Ouib isoform X2 [Drosophila rhopaloa]|nr:transcription factor Ouib isoform X2 [Drosophila rhopaloa]